MLSVVNQGKCLIQLGLSRGDLGVGERLNPIPIGRARFPHTNTSASKGNAVTAVFGCVSDEDPIVLTVAVVVVPSDGKWRRMRFIVTIDRFEVNYVTAMILFSVLIDQYLVRLELAAVGVVGLGVVTVMALTRNDGTGHDHGNRNDYQRINLPMPFGFHFFLSFKGAIAKKSS
jgi:hypothetical protein